MFRQEEILSRKMPFMPKSMRKTVLIKIAVISLFFSANQVKSQNATLGAELNNFMNDAVFFTDKYITPATDAAVYQAASSWVNTPRKAKLWDFTLGIHGNAFVVPKSDRSFAISNSDFKFFQIENATSGITPSALGNNQYLTLVGQLTTDDSTNPPTTTAVTLKTPEGINMETVIYPYAQASLGLFYGTEFIAKYSPKTQLKNVEYQVFGFGLKHNLSQYFKNLDKKNIHLSALVGYANEDITVAFLDVKTAYGDLGLNALSSKIDTWQLQFNGSKEFKKLELSAGVIMNTSNFDYKLKGKNNKVLGLDVQEELNKRLTSIYKTKVNYIGEIAARYKISHFYLQTSLAFGKFVNSNLSIQYQFNKNKK
jgi:hypothetical protein